MYGQNGSTAYKIIKKNSNFKLVTLTENRIINKKFSAIKPELNTEKAFKKTDIIIDFTIPSCTLENAKNCFKTKKKGCYRNNRF